jgi:hypothetical protein
MGFAVSETCFEADAMYIPVHQEAKKRVCSTEKPFFIPAAPA